MKEDLLHFVWKHKKLPIGGLQTTNAQEITIITVGDHNFLSGPDFFNAKIKIAEQLWAGNIEIHVRSSDWYAHHHETDEQYNNVILHVVWEDDVPVYRENNTVIPSLELKQYIPDSLLKEYKLLLNKSGKSFINCEKDMPKMDSFFVKNWLERLYFERLEQKSLVVQELLVESNNDWEYVLFCMLMKNFGLNINGESFLSITKAIDFSIVRKVQSNVEQMEALLYGLGGLLAQEEDVYSEQLEKEYAFLSSKFGLNRTGVIAPTYFKLRPPNFPTIRLSQIAHLYKKQPRLFSVAMRASNKEELYAILEVTASVYWDTHYVFGKESKKSSKRLTKKFIDLLIINTILPIKFCYYKQKGQGALEEIVDIIRAVDAENNTIVKKYNMLKIEMKGAMDSQALLQLYHFYCKKNNCLQCAIGGRLLNRID